MKGHIRKRGKESWALVIDLGRDSGGKRKQKWHTIHGTKKDAQRELRRLLTSLDEGIYVEPTKITVASYLNTWLDHVRVKVGTKTYSRYAEICRRHLEPAFGHLLLTKLQPLHIQEYYSVALQSGRLDGRGALSTQTVLHHHRVLRGALQCAVKWNLLVRNPADATELPQPDKKEMRALDESETATLLKAAQGTRLYIRILLTVTAGLRRGELLGLKWNDIDFKRGKLSVRRAVEQTRSHGVVLKTPKSKKSIRTIALLPMAVEALQRHRLDQKKEKLLMGPAYQDEGLVFPQANGTLWKPDSFTKTFIRLAQRSGVGKLRFHDLRHSHATQLLRQGVHPKIVSERLGHSSVGITLDTYSHVLPGMQEDAANKLETALRSAIENC